MTTLTTILHQKLSDSRTIAEPFRIYGLSFYRLNSDLCEDVFLISSNDVNSAINAIEEENIHRQEMGTPLEKNFNFTLEGSSDTGPVNFIVQFDLEAVRANYRKLLDKERYQTQSGIVTVDNVDSEGTLCARMIIYDYHADDSMLFDVLYGMDGLTAVTDQQRFVAG